MSAHKQQWHFSKHRNIATHSITNLKSWKGCLGGRRTMWWGKSKELYNQKTISRWIPLRYSCRASCRPTLFRSRISERTGYTWGIISMCRIWRPISICTLPGVWSIHMSDRRRSGYRIVVLYHECLPFRIVLGSARSLTTLVTLLSDDHEKSWDIYEGVGCREEMILLSLSLLAPSPSHYLHNPIPKYKEVPPIQTVPHSSPALLSYLRDPLDLDSTSNPCNGRHRCIDRSQKCAESTVSIH